MSRHRKLAVGTLLALLTGLVPAHAARAGGPDVAASFQKLEQAIAEATATSFQQAVVTPERRDAAAEYVRQIAQLLLGVRLLAADPEHPVLLRDPDPLAIVGADPPARSGIYNPDNISYIAIVDPSRQYRVTGRRGNAVDFSVQVISGFPGSGTTGNPTATLLADDITVDARGRWAVTVGGEVQANDHLPMQPDTTIVTVRQAFDDWSVAKPDRVRLEVVGADGGPARRLSDAQLVDALEAAASELLVQAPYWLTLWGGLQSTFPANQVRTPAPTMGGLAGQLSSLSRYDVPDGQALVVSVGKSDAAYQGLEVADVFGQTLPYATRQTSLNAQQADPGADGRIHVVLSAQDPGVPNWIDIEDHPQGFLFLRWQGLPGPLPESARPSAQLVPLGSVREVLPEGTPTVTPGQRTRELRRRAASVGDRLRTSSNEAAPLLTSALRQVADEVGTKRVLDIYTNTNLSAQLRRDA